MLSRHVLAGLVCLAFVGGFPFAAHADDEPLRAPEPRASPTVKRADENFDYETSRYEPAGFPLIGGDSDIGFEFGAVGTLSKFGHGIEPYQWNMDAVAALSMKRAPSGNLELTQQQYLWTIDLPGLLDRTVRLIPTASYLSTINNGYFGLGNASGSARPEVPVGDAGRYFQYKERALLAREVTRIRFRPPVDIALAANYRYESPSGYEGSKLAEDAASGRVRGLNPMSIVMLGAGIVYDSRDNEYFPRRGSYHQIGIRFNQGFPIANDVHYAAAGAIFATYKSLGGPFVLAARGLVDAQFGKVPFYDLFNGEPFVQLAIIGGANGVRGVPEGRYLGRLKAVGNIELRSMLVDFHLFQQAFHLGADTFFDAGRVWSDYTFTAREDGSGFGVKWGAGAGIYLRWGQAAVFRLEVAYSPDAVAENPNFPLGVYVQDGVMF